jgi:hypothetical protein
MNLDIRKVRTRWINADKDVHKAGMMKALLDGLAFEDHGRFPAITGIKPHRGAPKSIAHYRGCAKSHFKLLNQTIIRDGTPVLILEDDVEVEDDAPTEIWVPDDADCIYLGTSHGNRGYQAVGYKKGVVRICGVLATHAILYLNQDFAKRVVKIGKKYVRKKHPFDVAMAAVLQPTSRVCALHRPMFYQADAKNEVNKWETMTRTPLIITDQVLTVPIR